MLKAMFHTYRTAGAFVLACPLLFLVPVVPELVQHVVEYKIGMFSSVADAKALENDRLRLLFGSIKVVALLFPGYWVARFAWWGDGARAGAWQAEGVRGYVPVLIYGVVVNMLGLWVPQLVGGRTGQLLALGSFPLLLILNILLSQWVARAPLGEGDASPSGSVRLVGRDLLWALPFGVIAMLPAMAVHYALNFLSLGKPLPAMAALLAIDAFYVGYLVAVLCCIPVTITRHAEARAQRRAQASTPGAMANAR
ncbi:hypothetical protein [Sphingomonas crusticola]|uniref:hypothetical protein n=1 Tax=Sphingomonas crusticola TaxID=1697973 RepID=UPI000E22594F|nr:hypothetical protein [Sphingomonas crusticola]